MLDLIIGTAGSGKTTQIYERISQLIQHADHDAPIILIVPEQFSFESERALCALLGERLALRVQVLSFTRLCHKIFYEFGQVAGDFLDSTGKYLLVSLAIEQTRDRLKVYQSQAGRTSFVSVVLDQIAEFKNAGIMPDDVFTAVDKIEGSRLREKLKELGILYQSYQALIDNSYRDPSDDLARAMTLSVGKGFFKNISVFIDGFTAFMIPEMRLIRQMLEENAHVTVTACADNYATDEGPIGVFTPVKASMHQLISTARRCGATVATPTILTGQYRARNAALCHLEEGYLREGKHFPNPQNHVRVLEAGDVYAEAQYIAREIVYLVFEHHYRYREIAVIARDFTQYADIFEDVFAQYQIPAYLDKREEVENFELSGVILGALLAVKSSLDTEQIISLSKLPLLGIPESDAFELENYCFVWNVRGRQWQSPFCNHPDGLRENMSEETEIRLARIELARQVLISPLLHLRSTLDTPSGIAFAEGIWTYLDESGAVLRLNDVYASSAGSRYVDIQSALFDSIVSILDLFHRVLGKQALSKGRLIELWRLAVQSCDVGKLPQTLDQVLVGMADRVRPQGIRAAFVCGANEGDFPLHFSGAGLLSDRERGLLKGQGMGLNTAQEDLVGLERFYTYFALTIPSERLYVTYTAHTISGEEKRPSLIVRELESLFEGCVSQSAAVEPLRGLRTRENAYSCLCETWRMDSAVRATLASYFADSLELGRLQFAVHAAENKNFQIEDKKNAQVLFGNTQAISPSRLERYYNCAFSYFCEGALELRKKRRVSFSALESGSLIHYILEVMVRKYCAGEGILPGTPKLKIEISALIETYLRERVKDDAVLDKRFKYLYSRLTRMLIRLITRLFDELKQSTFKPCAFELPINPQNENRPIVLETAHGNRVYVQGVVDRVDLMENTQGKYLRVVDYKSGSKSFSLADVYYGLNMQMLIYLFTLSENGEKTLRGAFPAGVLYMPAREETLSVPRDTSPEAIAELHADGYRMNGLLLDNIPVLSGMERELNGVFIPAKLKKDGTLDSKSKIASLEEFGKLGRYVQKLIRQMANNLSDGRVEALPVSGLGHDPCAYCDYGCICRLEEQHPRNELAPLDDRTFFEQITKEEESLHASDALDPKPD